MKRISAIRGWFLTVVTLVWLNLVSNYRKLGLGAKKLWLRSVEFILACRPILNRARNVVIGFMLLNLLVILLGQQTSNFYRHLDDYVGSPVMMSMIEDVNTAGGLVALHDNHGSSMDCAKVILADDGSYLAFYHTRIKGIYEVDVATSYNLKDWVFRAKLGSYASQPTAQRAPPERNGYFVAWEQDQLKKGVDTGRSNVEIVYYPDLATLLSGRPSKLVKSIVLPHIYDDTVNEGTPNFYDITMGKDIYHSELKIGFHSHDGGVDGEAYGTLYNFNAGLWFSSLDFKLNTALGSLGFINGNHGDRDAFWFLGNQYIIVEAQAQFGVFPSFQVFLYDRISNRISMLVFNIPNLSGNYGVANPTFTNIVLPGGALGFVVTIHIFDPRGDKQLLFWRSYKFLA